MVYRGTVGIFMFILLYHRWNKQKIYDLQMFPAIDEGNAVCYN